ncbi:MAG: ABC transporter ATP-binding protein, partial [Asticcacaulis sp.]
RPVAERAGLAEAMLERVGLAALSDQGVFNLSGGQRARVLLARLMATQCPVMVLDEPLAALDPAWQRQVLWLLKQMAAAGHTVIVSLHDIGLAVQMCDEVLVLSEGRLIAQGAPDDVISPQVLRDVFGLSGAVHEGHLRVDALPVGLA